VHPTGGSLRVFKQFAWLEVDSVKMALSCPAHQPVTQAVSPLRTYEIQDQMRIALQTAMKLFNPLLMKLTFSGAIIATTIVTILSLIAFGARYWWVGELLRHPRPQYSFVLVICLPFIVWRFRRAGWLILIPLLLNSGTFAPLYLPPQHMPIPTSRQFTALHYSLDNALSSHSEAFAYLRDHPVDILSLQELTPETAAQLSQELPEYEVVYSHPMTNSQGSVVLISSKSGIQVHSAGIIHLPKTAVRPLIETILDIQGHSIAFLSLHVVRPVNARKIGLQQTEFEAVAKWSRHHQKQEQAVLILGDFNSTSWSMNFQQFQKDGDLLNSEQGFGLEPTWPANLPSLFSIPIDHCLYSSGIVIVNRFTGPYLGSDHAPLHINFMLADSP
jgi:endonuclease/exonuclease/phosphatase (EEP) superfamily protein YafD